MPKWEICEVRWSQLREVRKRSFLSADEDIEYIGIYIAALHTPEGQRAIYEGSELSTKNPNFNTLLTEERSKLISRVLADGWEPLQSGESGTITFKRPLSEI